MGHFARVLGGTAALHSHSTVGGCTFFGPNFGRCSGCGNPLHQEAQRGRLQGHEAQEYRTGPGMGDRPTGEAIDPKSAPVERGMRGRVLIERTGHDVPRGQISGPERVINTLTGKGLDDTGRIAHVDDAVPQRADGGALERGDGAPSLAGRNCESGGDGSFQSVEIAGGSDETEIREAGAHGSDPAIPLRQQVQLDVAAEAGWSGEMGLEGNAIAPGGGRGAQQTRDGGIAAIGGDEAAGGEATVSRLYIPDAGGIARKGADCGALANYRAGLLAAPEKNGIQDTPGHRDFARLTALEGEGDTPIIGAGEGNAGDRNVRGIEQRLSDAEFPEDGPAPGVQAIAANLVAGEEAFLQDNNAQSGLRAQCAASRTRGAAAGDGEVERLKAEGQRLKAKG